MARADLLVLNASTVLTLRGPARPRRRKELTALGEVPNGGIAVQDGTILDVGPSARIRSRYRSAHVLDAEGRAIVPGFVDAHTHLPFAGSRAFELELKLAGKSYLDILRAGGGIHRTVRDTRAASEARLVRGMRARMDTMLAWGTTTAEAKSGYGLSLRDELKQLRAIRRASRTHPMDLVPTFLGAHVVPKEFARRRKEYLELLTRRIIPAVAKGGLAEYCDAFLESDAFSAAECEAVLAAARRAGLKTKLHADEFTNQKGAELAARLGCVSAEHLLKVSAAGIRALARSETLAVLLPGVSVTSFLDAFAPARRLIDGGATVALGTDLNPNCHVLTMPTVIQWACYHLRMTPAEALQAATANAAHAVGRGAEAGTIERGKWADFLVLASGDPLDLAYRVGPNPVALTIKRGRIHRAASSGRASPIVN